MIGFPELSTSAATLLSALLGGIIGSIGTYYAQHRLQNSKREKRTEWVRQALMSELETMDALDKWPHNPDGSGVPHGNWLHNQVYESISGELGRLDEDEMSALIAFHGGARHVMSDIDHLSELSEDEQQKSISIIHSHLSHIKYQRRAAMHLIARNQDT
ncbi:hypothetical protein [Halorubrum tebenquichense]|uniref:hypothetical protein n=1 Tax=Halorubrum tebenquichense TaxID=119434 RepID=UPI0012678EC2|nr:hypothetical protein [Halorubrum tebenquichense]